MTTLSEDTLSDYLDASVVSYAPPALIGPTSLSCIQQLARMLPGQVSEFFGFECPLGSSEAAADFLICAKAEEAGREILAGKRAGQQLPTAFDSAAWKTIQRFAAIWNDPSSPLFHNVHNCWLEFDIGAASSTVPQPSVFFGSDELRPELDAGWLVDCALPILSGGTLSVTARNGILHCIERLPQGAQIFQVGRMLARASTATRLCARGIPSEDIPDYLESIGWKGFREDLLVVVEGLAEHTGRIDLDLDVDSTAMPKLGLECYTEAHPAAFPNFVTYLESAGFCRPEKAAQLKQWAGMAHQLSNPTGWPGGLRMVSSFLNGRFHSAFVRWVHHVKVVYEPGRPLQAKAYMAVKHVWLSPATLREILLGALPDLTSKSVETRMPAEERTLC